jgi:signal peptidase II
MMIRMRRSALVFLAGMTIGCDQGTKKLAATLLADKPVQSFFGDVLRLLYAENSGGFLGLGANLPPAWRTLLFTAGTGVFLALSVILLLRCKWPFGRMMGLTLFIAGGASNWIDRAVRGSVVDFMNIGFGALRTGIFNVADMAIMAGAALLLLPGFPDKKFPAIPSERIPSG